MGDYHRILSGEVRRGWKLLIPHTYLRSLFHPCEYGWSKETKGDHKIGRWHDSSILITEDDRNLCTVKIRRFSTIFPKISADIAVIRYSEMVWFINSVYLTPNILGVVFDGFERLKIVVFNAFSPQQKFAVWKITAPGADYEYQYKGSMFLDEHSRRLVMIFKTSTRVRSGTTKLISPKGFAMVAYELSTDYNTILNDGMGTIICEEDVLVSPCISLGDNEAIMEVVSDGENDLELRDIITIDRMGIKRRQSVAEWLEISESQRPDFMEVKESYEMLQIGKHTNAVVGYPSRPFALYFGVMNSEPIQWYFQSNVMSRCMVGAWYAKTEGGILCKRTQVDSLKNLAAKAIVGMYPSEIDVVQLRAGMKMMVGFDVFEAVVEDQPLSVEVNSGI